MCLGQYNETYLDQIAHIVDTLRAQDIFVILDCHQDIWHRKFCGEGVPDYVYEACVAEEAPGTAAFPQPVVDDAYPTDADGNPQLEACLSRGFASYYLTAEVGAGFQCLYDNKQQLWDAFGGYWQAVARRFKGVSNVLGYELLNEPWAGDVVAEPRNLLPHYTEQKYLQPMYQHLHEAIRTEDDEKIIFFEGLTIDYWRSGFTEGPGGPEYNDRQALSYHIYCPQNHNDSIAIQVACEAIDDAFFQLRSADAERLGTPMLMTEFGAVEDFRSDLVALERVAQLADRHMQSWMYWEYKYFQDITTITPEGEGLFNSDGTVHEDKLRVLSRTYPQALAGSDGSYRFDAATANFQMRFALLSTDASGTVEQLSEEQRTTEVYVNRPLHYPHGLLVEVSGDGAAALQVQCPKTADDDLLRIVQQPEPLLEQLQVEVKISKCVPLLQKCTCE